MTKVYLVDQAYVELAGIDPKYKDIAWAVQSPGVAKTLVGSMARNPEEAVFSNLIGSPEQHRSNKVVFDRIMDRFEKAVEEDKLTPELHQTINKRLANIKDPKTGKSFFPEDVDILSPEFNQHAQTFHQRAYIADILAGKGVGGKKGSIIDYPQVIKETTDPLLLEAKTGDIGDRLFSLSGNIQERPELHPAFHYSLSGKKESEAFAPAPQGIVLKNFTKDFTERTGRLPTYYDLTRGYAPSEKVTDEMLERMYKEGYAGGGKVLSKGLKLLEDVVEKVKLPPAENSARTQIVGTMPTYEKARDILGKEGIKGADIIDFGAGKGLGSTSMKADSFEPYPQGWYPTYTKSEDIPSEKYKGLLNLNVLNVLDPEMRAHTVKEIGRVMQPEGGTGLITTRGRDVLNTVGGKAGNEPMSIITSRDTYQKGFEPEELRKYIRYILGGDFEYEPLNLGQAGVKIKKKAEGGTIADDAEEYGEQLKEQRKTLGSDILKSGAKGITEGVGNILRSAKETLSRAGTIGDVLEGYGKYGAPMEKARYEGITGTKIPQFKPVPYLPEQSITESPVGAKILPLTTGEQQFAGEIIGDPLSYSVSGAGRGLKKFGKFIGEGLAEAEATGKGPVGKVMQTIVPRFNVIKDPGGMVVGGEKALDQELLNIKKNEGVVGRYVPSENIIATGPEGSLADKNAVALNNWIDTKVRKYIRNQAGSKDDPILKTIESGVEHNFTPPQSGDTKYSIAMKRKLAGKDPEGIATTERGKNWEYTVDSIFNPVKSSEIKDILQRNKDLPPSEASDKFLASVLRTEHDLPIYNKQDLENLKLINQIPDETVYGLNPEITNRLGLNHMTDVLSEDLNAGRLRPEQLNQMSIEKAIRRVAEYDAEKAKIASKAEADRIKDLPTPITYNKDYKWLELNHPTDPAITKEALKSEGNQMGHCVGTHCDYYDGVMNGSKQIFSLRDANNKPHVTIETNIVRDLDRWLNANKETISKDPELSKKIFTDDFDEKYPRSRIDDEDLVNEYIGNMKKIMKEKGLPINEDPGAYVNIKQVKGNKNSRPKEEYQDYVTDFIQKNPTGHEIADIKELDNTNLMSVDNVGGYGLVPKDIHFHPDVEKIVKNYPTEKLMNMYRNANMQPSQTEFSLAVKENIFREAAKDFAKQGKSYFTKDELINYLKDKYLPTQKAKGGSIDLQQEYKLENMRRRYG
jgi:hypothetical protein